jgi:hypothetical protein
MSRYIHFYTTRLWSEPLAWTEKYGAKGAYTLTNTWDVHDSLPRAQKCIVENGGDLVKTLDMQVNTIEKPEDAQA